jgi:hypothetical protein
MRRDMRIFLAALALALPLVVAPSAQAKAGTPETIVTHMNVDVSGFPSGPPWVGTYYGGTFTASGAFDATGTYWQTKLYGALPAPNTSAATVWQTLTDTQGDTLVLHCTLYANDFSNWADIPNTGTCSVHGGTGPFALLSGSGKISGFYDDVVSPPTEDDTAVIPTSS